MRFRYYMVVQDLAGNVVDGASVYVYLAGTSTPAVVYPTRASSEGSNTPPQVSSALDGSVVFWLDSDDYSYGQLFDIVVQKGSFSFQLSDVQIIVWDAVNASNSAKLGGYEGSYYLNRANHAGTQPPSTISPQGSGSGLDADQVDGIHASSTPTANKLLPLGSDGKFPSSVVREIGVGQSWRNVISSRSAGVTYTNNTGKPILVCVQLAVPGAATFYVDGAVVYAVNTGYTFYPLLSVIVPDGSTYKVTVSGDARIWGWRELR